MTILGFTTSTDESSIALFSKGKIFRQFSWTRKLQQSEALTLFIKSLLKKNSIPFSKLNLIAVDIGPGSFTGSRVAVNVAKTLAFDLNLPIFAATSLDTMAEGFLRKSELKSPYFIFSILDAHRSLFYFRKYKVSSANAWSSENSILALSLEDIVNQSPTSGALVVLGQLSPENFHTLKINIEKKNPTLNIVFPKIKALHHPQATALVSTASLSQSSEYRNWTDVEPSYVRSPDAVEALKAKTMPSQKSP